MKIAYLGAGTWGTALALLLVDNKHELKVWDVNSELLDILDKTRKHPKLPGIAIPKSLKYVRTIEEAIDDAELIIESVTSAGIRPVLNTLKKLKGDKLPAFVFTSKGIEQKTGLLFPEVALEVLGEHMKDRIGCISGPSHAEEVVKKLPTSLVGTSYDRDLMMQIVGLFNTPYFRVYPNSDIHGVAFGGALKNVIAIACAISDGLGYGENAKAALLTRGLHEMRKLSKFKGCNPDTLNGLAGLGDVFVTCVSTLSRNYQFGRLMAQGYSIEEARDKIGMVVEGVYSCVSAMHLAEKYNVAMPITELIYKILYKNFNAREAVLSLLQRQIKDEHL